MALHGMPFLLLNLGVEMIFVLDSRLRAQAVAPEKAIEVRRDIGANIFSVVFMTELFTPQPLYTSASVLQVFAALSNTSVMHLSDNSLRKLYDLVFMTVKYQVLTLRHPMELYELTLNHLEAAAELVPPSVQHLIADATERLKNLARTFTLGDWAEARRALLNFFAGRHVRVSVFLENQVQDAATGAFFIPPDAYLTPLKACAPPGLVRMEHPAAGEEGGAESTGTFAHPEAKRTYPPHIPPGAWDPTNRATRMTTNGFNMYASSHVSKSRERASAEAPHRTDPLAGQTREMPQHRPAASALVSEAPITPAVTTEGLSTVMPPASLSHAELQHAYDAEVNYLAQIAGSTRPPCGGISAFELDLFQDIALNHTSSKGGGATTAPPPSVGVPPPATADTPGKSVAPAPAPPQAAAVPVPVSHMSATAVQEQNKKLLGIMSGFDASSRRKSNKRVAGGGGGGGSADATASAGAGQDLLDIMDEISE